MLLLKCLLSTFIFSAQHGGLYDLVPVVSRHSNTYFVQKEVVEHALRNSDSYLEYTVTLFDAFIVHDVALLCVWADYTNEDVDDGHVRASLPAEAMTVFLSKFLF